jgi:hypothetical protein
MANDRADHGADDGADEGLSRLLADVLSAEGDDLSAGILGQSDPMRPAADSSPQLDAASHEHLGTSRAALGGDSDNTRLIEVESQINAARVSVAAGFERALHGSRRLRWLPWKWISRSD